MRVNKKKFSVKNVNFFRNLFTLIIPYWKSDEKFKAWGLLLTILFFITADVGIAVWQNHWTMLFYNSLQKVDKHAIFINALQLIVITLSVMFCSASQQFFSGLLSLHWRKWMTHQYISRWFDVHHKGIGFKTLDNPDQRISQDISEFSTITLSLFSALFTALLTVGSFFWVLWKMSGIIVIPIGNHYLNIHGYLIISAILYALIVTFISMQIGKPLSDLNYSNEKYNGNFRHNLVMTKDNIAYCGKHTLFRNFKCIFLNSIKLLRVQRRLWFFVFGLESLTSFVGLAVGLPRLLTHQIKIGGLLQISNAFSRVQVALSFIANSYTSIATLNAAINRIIELDKHFTHNATKKSRGSISSENSGLVVNERDAEPSC